MHRNDLLIALASSTVLCSLLWAVDHGRRMGGADPRLLLDAEQQREIHSAMLLFADTDITGDLPRPGKINRFTAPGIGWRTGWGPENVRKNSSSHLYSAMIAQRYIDPAILISPGEVNPAVAAFGAKDDDAFDEYDYEAYQPAADVYWMGDTPDPSTVPPGTVPSTSVNRIFLSKINRPVPYGRGHASYAHLALESTRVGRWSNRADHRTALLGTRGPKRGVTTGDEFDRSPTLRFFGPSDVWVGNVCLGDGQIKSMAAKSGGAFTVDGVDYTCAAGPIADNIFESEFESCSPELDDDWEQGDIHLSLSEIVTLSGSDSKPRVIHIHDAKEEVSP